ncbi:MAG: alpha-xylosidase, partial [Clostridia bacterium]|nr:alpha-xylosidase [Clostridia bacterium]
NLKGMYRTLDCCDGNRYRKMPWSDMEEHDIQLKDGVCSKTGVAVFDDAKSLSMDGDGKIIPQRGEGVDLYVFAYGNDYLGAVKGLYLICGATPLIPRFALGNWWSRYHDYTDVEYLKLIQRFEDYKVPLTVAAIDMDWHYSHHVDEELKITESGKNTLEYTGGINWGWTGYTWNKNLFPDYKSFLKKLKAKNVKVMLNLHPADGIRWWEERYGEMADRLGVDKNNQKCIPFDIADTNFINAYFDVLHKPYEREGVDFWWVDWQQGESSGMEGLDPLWALNHYHYLDNASNHSEPLILSRYSGIGAHRYPVGFSGDTLITWDTLKYLPYFTATASNVGYAWWSHDIGGHMAGVIDGELYLRHVQFGVFSPINRLHSNEARVTTKEPWCYKNGRGELIMQQLRFRHQLIPFLYACSYQCHAQGVPLIQPLYYMWDKAECYAYEREYVFGENFIVAPVTEPMKDGFAKTRVWLPKGVWTDIFTGDEYDVKEDAELDVFRPLDSIPVFAAEGAVLPLSKDDGNGCENPENLEVYVFNGNGRYVLYEDNRYVGGENRAFTEFDLSLIEGGGVLKQVVTISTKGDGAVIPKNRKIILRFKNIEEGDLQLKVNGQAQPIAEKLDDELVAIIDFSVDCVYEITAVFKPRTRIQKLIERAAKVLLSAECENHLKWQVFEKLNKSATVEGYVEEVENCALNCRLKARLLETV